MPETVKRIEKNREISITTPLGENKLLLLEMQGSESLGRLFEYELTLVAEESAVDFKKILGQNVTVHLKMNGDAKRHFNGYISRFTFVGVDETRRESQKIFHYRATLVPRTWFLTRVANSRIFQEMTVPDIIKKICEEHGYTDIDPQLTGKYGKWEYCVQYRETDFNFISRLMEEEGIYYYFKHDDKKHVMVLCDAPSAHTPAADYKALSFDKPDLKSGNDAFIWEWVMGHEITSTKYTLEDYNMTTPSTELLRSQQVEHSHDSAKYEVFDYPGGYGVGDDGVTLANVRMEETEAQYAVARATTSARGVHAGVVFTMDDHPALDPCDYLVTGGIYRLLNDDLGLGLGRTPGATYSAQITCIPKSYEFRTPRLTPKPSVQGPQTAVVVGPKGEEIYTDSYGRVKVQFHWDRVGKKDEHSSCWIRVSQNWAGKQWGIVFNPRIGQEVIVDFLEGDPDCPIITGRVYNAEQMPPYTLPANQTQSGIKSRSSKGGAAENFNEFRFEDKKGNEQVFLHAEKNQDIEVENDETHWVGHDRTKTIDHDETNHIKHDRTETVDNNETITVHGNRTETVDKDETITIDGNRTETVQKNETITINKSRTTSITEAEKLTVGKDCSVSIGGNKTLSVSKELVITAGDSITITTGDASITMKKDGTITIKGKDITFNASGKITGKASGDVVLKGSSVKQN